MKRRLTALFIGMLLLVMLPVLAHAEEAAGEPTRFLQWEFDESTGTLTLTGSGDMSNYSYLDDYGIQDLPPWSAYLSEIKTIILPDGLWSIGRDAFRNCTKLESITIPDSVREIRMHAFKDCTSLKTIDFGSGVEQIGHRAFDGCTALKSITLPGSGETVEDEAFRNCTAMTSATLEPGVKSINANVFRNCKKLTSIKIGDGIEHIGESAFRNTGWWDAQPNGVLYIDHCLIGYKESYPQNVVIRDGTKMIADYALWGCINMTSVTIPDSVEYIGKAAFGTCRGLTSLTIPYGVKSIGQGAFGRVENVKTIVIPDSVTFMGVAAFQSCTALESFTLPNHLERIEQRTFSGCSALKTIVIPDSVTEICENAFSDCTSLTSITIPETMTKIYEEAFSGCTGLKSITVPCGLGLAGFNDCKSIDTVHITKGTGRMLNYSTYSYKNTPWYWTEADTVTVTLDEGIEYIGEKAFYECDKLRSFTIPNSVTAIGDYAFSRCTNLGSIAIPDSVTDLGRYTFEGCTGLKSITLGRGFTTINHGVFGNCTGLTSIEIPDTVQNLNGFNGCTGLKSVTIPDSVRSIGQFAFSGCTGLLEVSISDSVTTLGPDAFSGCTALKSVTIPDSVTTMGNEVFGGCTALKSIRIPDGITRIELNMFYNCTSLEYIFFGSGMTYVNDWAFHGCTALTDVYYNGTEAQRNEKFPVNAIGKDNDALKNATWHFILEDERPINATVEFGSGVLYKGTTPYVIANGKAQTPEIIVKDENGTVVGPLYYDAVFSENTNAGTAYVDVILKNGYTGTAQDWFKIYLPATTWTKVENVSNGILIQWAPVEGAAGYVIYRRAWSTTTNGWTRFERWWNVTGTSWIDGTDNHSVYAGTRYQYGVKAYFARRTDPVSGAEIGGNVNEPSGNYNLGEVGPLKTTVRITSRVLNSVTAGSKRMTIKWTPTKYFTGIQVQYAEDANFTKNCKEYKIAYKIDANGNTVSPVPSEDTIKGLTSGKTYYVRICSYHLFEGTTYYGEWSNVLSCTVK